MLTLGVDNWGSQPYIRSTLHSSFHGGLLKDAELAPCRLQPRWLRPGKGGNWGHRGFWLPVRESRWSQGNCRAGNSPITLGIIINVILVFLFPFHSTLGLIGYTEKLSYSISMPAPQCACLFISKRERGGKLWKGEVASCSTPPHLRASHPPLFISAERTLCKCFYFLDLFHSGYKMDLN